MNILLIGYGKMGKAIHQLAEGKGHRISGVVDMNEGKLISEIDPKQHDVAIEFTQPESAVQNIEFCLKHQLPIVSGTTGWLEKLPEVEKACSENQGAFFYASNFSVGVNIFFKVNQYLAKLMNGYAQYDVDMEETHHTQKKDAPSGTAITLAEGILGELARKTAWHSSTHSQDENEENSLSIASFRKPDVPGTHVINYNSEIDSIEIKHTAHSRQGFALGAVLASEWIVGRQGIFRMDDLLGL